MSDLYPGLVRFRNLFAEVARAARLWQLVALLELAVLILVLGAYIHLASTSRITPYIVEVDALGRARAFGPAEEIRSTDDRLTRYLLTLFVRNLRTVTTDPAVQRAFVFQAFAYVTGEAQATLERYFSTSANDPRNVALRVQREVQVESVLRVPDTTADTDTWRVQWLESERSVGNGAERRRTWEAFFTVKVDPPETTDLILTNPLGLYVTALSWSETTPSGGDLR